MLLGCLICFDTQKSASYFDLHLKMDNGVRIKTLISKTDVMRLTAFFPFISSNIPTSPAYGVYLSKFLCYSRAFAQCHDFLDRAQLLMWKLLK